MCKNAKNLTIYIGFAKNLTIYMCKNAKNLTILSIVKKYTPKKRAFLILIRDG